MNTYILTLVAGAVCVLLSLLLVCGLASRRARNMGAALHACLVFLASLAMIVGLVMASVSAVKVL